MSEIREKARSFLNHGAEINRHKLIHDLLAELERMEGLAGIPTDRIAELECQKNACQQVISEREQRIAILEEENARLKALGESGNPTQAYA